MEKFLQTISEEVVRVVENVKVEEAEEFSKVMVPGESELLREAERLVSGVPVTKSVYAYLAQK